MLLSPPDVDFYFCWFLIIKCVHGNCMSIYLEREEAYLRSTSGFHLFTRVCRMSENMEGPKNIQWNLWIADNYRSLKNCLLLRGTCYWEVIFKRLSHFGPKVLSVTHGLSTLEDVRYWEVSLYIDVSVSRSPQWLAS